MMKVLWFLLYGGVTVEDIGIDVNSGGYLGFEEVYNKVEWKMNIYGDMGMVNMIIFVF